MDKVILHKKKSSQLAFCEVPKYNIINVSQHIERYQLSGDWILSYGDAKSKYLKI